MKFTNFIDKVDFNILRVNTIYRTQVVLPDQWKELMHAGYVKEDLLLENIVNIVGDLFLARNELSNIIVIS